MIELLIFVETIWSVPKMTVFSCLRRPSWILVTILEKKLQKYSHNSSIIPTNFELSNYLTIIYMLHIFNHLMMHYNLKHNVNVFSKCDIYKLQLISSNLDPLTTNFFAFKNVKHVHTACPSCEATV